LSKEERLARERELANARRLRHYHRHAEEEKMKMKGYRLRRKTLLLADASRDDSSPAASAAWPTPPAATNMSPPLPKSPTPADRNIPFSIALPELATNPPIFPTENRIHVDPYDPSLWKPGAADSIPIRAIKPWAINYITPHRGNIANPVFYRVIDQIGHRGDAILKAWERLQTVDVNATYLLDGMPFENFVDFFNDVCILHSNALVTAQDLHDAWKEVDRPPEDTEDYDRLLFLSHSMFSLLKLCANGLGVLTRKMEAEFDDHLDSVGTVVEEEVDGSESATGGAGSMDVAVKEEEEGSESVMGGAGDSVGVVVKEEEDGSESAMSGIGGIGAVKEEERDGSDSSMLRGVGGSVAVKKERGASSTRPRTRSSKAAHSEPQLPPGSHSASSTRPKKRSSKATHSESRLPPGSHSASSTRPKKRSSKTAHSEPQLPPGDHTGEWFSDVECTGVKRPVIDLT
jgi:hypothetical protein